MAEVAVSGRRASEGKRRAVRPQRGTRAPLAAGLALAALVSAIAWFFLVRAAIDFGQVARNGEHLAWTFTGAATIGATACLLLVFVLGARVLSTLGLISEYKPRRVASRRAAR